MVWGRRRGKQYWPFTLHMWPTTSQKMPKGGVQTPAANCSKELSVGLCITQPREGISSGDIISKQREPDLLAVPENKEGCSMYM